MSGQLRHLVIGKGEVGSAIGAIIEESGQEVSYYDRAQVDPAPLWSGGVVHICFPYSSEFVDQVKNYQALFNPELTIIHSTVEVGTTRKIGGTTAYSFVRGRHPYLRGMMRKFTKHVAAVDISVASVAGDVLTDLGFEVAINGKPESVELGKLWDTTYYGICIAATKLAKEMADHYDVPYQVIEEVNRGYNAGMRQLGTPQFIRPELAPTPGPIGGHCVVPNAEILRQTFSSKLLDAVVEAK